MSPLNKILSEARGIYDETQGLCYVNPDDVANSAASEDSKSLHADRYTALSRSTLLKDAFGNTARIPKTTFLGSNPLHYSPWILLTGVTACNSAPSQTRITGDSIASVNALGAERSLSQSIRGNINGVDLAGEGRDSTVAWSVFDSSNPTATGTFVFLQEGDTGGSLFNANNDASALHLFTSTAVMLNGETVVAYTLATGDGEPSSIEARHVSHTGTSMGNGVSILAPNVHTDFPDAKLVAQENGFVAAYRDGEGKLAAVSFDANDKETGRNADLGEAPSQYVLSHGSGNTWALAQVDPTGIRVRTFDGLQASGVDTLIPINGSPSSLALAMQEEDGRMMLAWHGSSGIDGVLLSPAGNLEENPFPISSSGLANTLALSSDHRGNFVFAWEQAGSILARIYDGTSNFVTPNALSIISSGDQNSDIHASVSSDGILSMVWVKSSKATTGEVLQDIVRRDYQLHYVSP
jgi:hypothetical protein